MEKYFSYDVARYQFVALINELFRHDLQLLHQSSDTEYAFFAEPGKDSDTIFHQKFYNQLRSGWKDLLTLTSFL